MATSPLSQPTPDSGGIHIGDVGGSVNFSALGDIVGGDKITTITTTIQISVEAITQRPLITASPYRGLDRFEDRDKDLFFGRDQLIKSLLAQLSASNVLLVLGASGSGKSSVVRAGLLPQLAQLIGARFRYFTFVPDVNPFESLRAALLAAGFSQAQTRELANPKPEAPAKLIHTLQREDDQWLFFVDQFEEIFTVGDEKLRASFIASLVAIAQDPSSSTKLVLAMRADFLDRFSPFPQFAKIIEKNIDLVADMHVDELRQAIEQPAARHGVVFEQGLVEEIIKDVQGQAGSLPLLQYTLDLLWQEEARKEGLADRHLSTGVYRELGGVRGALQKRADEIYAFFKEGSDARTVSPKQEMVRQIFLRLVDFAGESSNDAAWRPVRRRASMLIFATVPEREILQELIDQKLLVSNRVGEDATVEVAHEALFTSWEQLKNWIEAGKQVIFAKNRLADDARRWQRRHQEHDAAADEELLRGSRLAQALDMRVRGDFSAIVGGLGEIETQFLDASAAPPFAVEAQRWWRRQQEGDSSADEELLSGSRLTQVLKMRARGDFSGLGGLREIESRFLDASATLRERRAQEEKARQQRDLEAAQRFAAVQRVAAGRLRKALAVAVVLLIASITGAYFGLTGQKTAQTETNKAEERRREVEKVNADLTLERSATKSALSRSDRETAGRLSANQEPAAAIAYLARSLENDPGNRLALAEILSTALETSWLIPAVTPMSVTSEISEVLFSPDANRALVDSPQKTHLFSRSDLNEMRLVADLRGAENLDLAFSADGRRIIGTAAGGKRLVGRWDSANGAPVLDRVPLEKFSPRPRYRAKFKAHVVPGTVQVVDEGDKPIMAPLYHASAISQAWASPDGTHSVTWEVNENVELDSTLSIWRLGHPGTLLRALNSAYPQSVRFSPGGRYVALDVQYQGYDGPKVTELYRLDSTARALTQTMEFFADLRVVDFSTDGRFALSAHAQGQLQLWHLADPPPPVPKSDATDVTDDVQDARVKTIVSLGDRGNPGEGLHPEDLAGLDLPVPADTPTPKYDGWADASRRFILFQAERRWQLWDAKTRRRIVLDAPAGVGHPPVFSSDYRWLVFHSESLSDGTAAALHSVALETGIHQTRPVECDAFIFSKSGQFIMTFSRYGGEIQVFDTATLEFRTAYHNPIQDKLWATEKVLALDATPELRAVLTALGGKRLGANGAMENVPPTEWLKLRAGAKPSASFASALVRWILDWPKDRWAPPF